MPRIRKTPKENILSAGKFNADEYLQTLARSYWYLYGGRTIGSSHVPDALRSYALDYQFPTWERNLYTQNKKDS